MKNAVKNIQTTGYNGTRTVFQSMKLRFVYLGGGSNPLLIEVPKSHLMFLNNISTSQF